MSHKPDTETLKAVNNNITDEFRANAGKVGGRFEGYELLLLTTTGAKSGEPRVAPLVIFRIDGKLLIVAGYGGADVNPAWVHNLRANPRAHVEVATDSFDVVAHELDPSEREAVIPKINATVPAFAFANYQSKTTRTIPIFELQGTRSRGSMQPAQTPAGKLATAFGDLDAMSALYHDDVVWRLPASMSESGGPFATMAPFAGKAAVRRFNEVINAAYDATTVCVVISDELEQGGLSVARFTYSAAMIPQGEVYKGEYLLLVRTQNGLIIEVSEFVDTWRVMKARGQA